MGAVAPGLCETLKQDIETWFGDRAGAVDQAEASAQDGLLYLAEHRALATGIPKSLGGDGGRLGDMAEIIATVATCCLTSAFVLWSHRVHMAYIEASNNGFLHETVLPCLLTVERLGATGLANAMKYAAGVEELRLHAQPSATGGVIVNGTIPWASNLVDDQFIVAVACRRGRDGVSVVAVPGDTEGVSKRSAGALVALDGTVSGSLRFDNVELSSDWVLSEEGDRFLDFVRPRFLLLQCGLPWGVTAAAVDSARRKLKGAKSSLLPRLERAQITLEGLLADVRDLSGRAEFSKHDLYRVCKTRKQLTELAVDAVWLELEVAGGAAYVAASDTARRLREVAFLPVQSPSLVQLRMQLEQLEKELQLETAAS